jgi:hypothetical protein
VVIPGMIEPHMHLWSTGVFFPEQQCCVKPRTEVTCWDPTSASMRPPRFG